MIELSRPVRATEELRAAVHRVVHDVVAAGGAVGHLAPPAREDTDAWLDDVFADVAVGDGVLVLASVDGIVSATGTWRRDRSPVFRHTAEVGKLMAHPSARGLGLGRRVLSALVESARDADLELLTLGVRGNNHGTIELYEELGFQVWGRLPNAIAVGDDRWDDVRMVLTLGHQAGVRLNGSAPGGLGSSPSRRVSGAGPARS